MRSPSRSGSSAGTALLHCLALARLPGRLSRGPSSRQNLSERRVDDLQRPNRVIRMRSALTPTAVPLVTISPVFGIEAPQAEEETDEDDASD